MTATATALELPTELTGARKVAVLLMSLDTDRAAQIIRQLSPDEVGAVALELGQLESLDPAVIDDVIADFAYTATSQRNVVAGGEQFARQLIEASLGSDGADEVYGRLVTTTRFEFLNRVDVPTLVGLLGSEHPQTIAVVLAHMLPDRAAKVLSALEEEVQCEIGVRIATMERTNPAAVDAIESALRARTEEMVAASSDEAAGVGGVESLIALLSRADKATEKAVLAQLEALDPEMAEAVRERLFVFEDIVSLEDRAVQQILRQVDTRGLAVALKGVEDVVRNKVMSNMSSRAAENLVEEIEMLRNIRAADVKESRSEIVKVIRALEESGDITISRGSDDDED